MPIPNMNVAEEFKEIVKLYREFEALHKRKPQSKAAKQALADGLRKSCTVLTYITGGGDIMTVEQKERALEIIKEVNKSGESANFIYVERKLLTALKLGEPFETDLLKLIQQGFENSKLQEPISDDWGKNLIKVKGVICRSAEVEEYNVEHRTLFRKTTAVVGGLLTAGANSAVGAMFLPALPFAAASIKVGAAVSSAAALWILQDFCND